MPYLAALVDRRMRRLGAGSVGMCGLHVAWPVSAAGTAPVHGARLSARTCRLLCAENGV